ncbi:DUF2244 domain-containing protein [Arhodomonas sp. SL1]|uniref:DUF2244 domain-containing protein n=1 Tax=Arhodomonas sp. SL1 TaxID=3425691 RepID=UPI003F883D18
MSVSAGPGPEEGTYRFVLRPAFGGHWPETVRCFAVIVIVALGVALVFTWLGFWPILPFAGLELSALGWALYVSARRELDTEVVTVGDTWVRIEKGRRRPESQWRLDRYFSEVWLEDTGRRPGAPRLFVRCGGERVELGSFLLEDDRRNLARQLRRCIGPVASAGIRPAA